LTELSSWTSISNNDVFYHASELFDVKYQDHLILSLCLQWITHVCRCTRLKLIFSIHCKQRCSLSSMVHYTTMNTFHKVQADTVHFPEWNSINGKFLLVKFKTDDSIQVRLVLIFIGGFFPFHRRTIQSGCMNSIASCN
jgi:hypothetical protein